MQAPYSVSLRDVGVSLGGNYIFRHVDLEIKPGECCVIVGPSGCGKTTLLRAIAGDIAFEGSIIVQNQRVVPSRPLNEVTLVSQTPALWAHLTVLENVTLVRRLCLRENINVARVKAMEWLTLVEVEHSANRYPHSLSGGEQQRIALVRGLAAERPVLLLDEVTSNIDVARRSIVSNVIADALSRGRMVIFVTHDLLTVRSMPYPVKELLPTGLRDATILLKGID